MELALEITIRNYEKEVLKLAEQYCEATGISLGTLGNKAASEFSFFTRMKDGSGGHRIETVRRAVKWIEEHMPKKPKK
jgi:hypothetical protein